MGTRPRSAPARPAGARPAGPAGAGAGADRVGFDRPGPVLPVGVDLVVRWARARPRRADLLLALLLALVMGVVSAAALDSDRPAVGWTAVQLAVAVLAPAALAARQWAPALSFGTMSVLFAVSELTPGLPAGQPFLPAAVVFPMGLYSYCVHGGPRASRAGAAVGVAGALLIAGRAVFGAAPADRGEADTLLGALLLLGFLLAVVAAAWSFGLFRTVRAVYLSTLEERARLAEAEREDRARRAVRHERDRIARELHDIVAHSLSVIVTQAQGAAYVAASRPDRAVRALDTIAETGREALADMRGLLGGLGGGGGTAEPPQPGLPDLPDLVARVRAAGLPVAYGGTGSPVRLGAAAGLAVYRLVQESLTNALKHAGPGAAARVELTWTGPELVVTVRDDGRGPAPGGTGGHGLVGMRERVVLAGGTVEAGPGPGGGFVVRATLPCPDGAR